MILKRPIQATILVFVLITGFHSWSLIRFPQVLNDEAWLVSRAWYYLQTGLVFGPLDMGVIDRFEGFWTFPPWLPTFIQSMSLGIFGSPSLLPARVVSLLFGMVLLGAIYLICISDGDIRLAILSVLIIATSRTFMISSHVARVDILAASLGYLALAIILYDRFSHWWVGLVSGLLVGLAFEIHPHSAIFVPAIFILFFAKLRMTILKQRQFWMFIVGGLIGMFFYSSIHIFRYPQTFTALNRLIFTSTHTPPIFTTNLNVLYQSTRDAVYLIYNTHFLSAILIPIAVIVLIVERKNLTILYLAGAIIISSILLIRNKFIEYGILITPIIGILIASSLLIMYDKFKSGNRGNRIAIIITLGLIVGISLLTSFLNVYFTIRNDQIYYQNVIYQLDNVIDPSDVIMAQQVYWFDFSDHKYYSWEQLVYFQRYSPGSKILDAFNEFKPDIFIIDSQLRRFITDSPGISTYSKYLTLPKSELLQILDDQAELISEFDGGVYGQIQVFRFNWDNN